MHRQKAFMLLKFIIVMSAFCLIGLGVQNLYYEKSVKTKLEMVKLDGTVSDYSCTGLSKYGDKLGISLYNIEGEIFFTDFTVNCDEISTLLLQNNFMVTAWADTMGSDYIGYSLLIGDRLFESSDIGKTYERLNLVAIIMMAMFP